MKKESDLLEELLKVFKEELGRDLKAEWENEKNKEEKLCDNS